MSLRRTAALEQSEAGLLGGLQDLHGGRLTPATLPSHPAPPWPPGGVLFPQIPALPPLSTCPRHLLNEASPEHLI